MITNELRGDRNTHDQGEGENAPFAYKVSKKERDNGHDNYNSVTFQFLSYSDMKIWTPSGPVLQSLKLHK